MRWAQRCIQGQTRHTAPGKEQTLEKLAAIALGTKKRAANDEPPEGRSQRLKLIAE